MIGPILGLWNGMGRYDAFGGVGLQATATLQIWLLA